jgi:hypothetical protein
MISELRMAQIVAVTRLAMPRTVPGNCTHEPCTLGAIAGPISSGQRWEPIPGIRRNIRKRAEGIPFPDVVSCFGKAAAAFWRGRPVSTPWTMRSVPGSNARERAARPRQSRREDGPCANLSRIPRAREKVRERLFNDIHRFAIDIGNWAPGSWTGWPGKANRSWSPWMSTKRALRNCPRGSGSPFLQTLGPWSREETIPELTGRSGMLL